MDNDELEEVPGYDIVEIVDDDAALNDTEDDDEGEDDDSSTSLDGTAPSVGEDRTRDPVLVQELAEAKRKLRALEGEKESGLNELQWGERFNEIQRQYRAAKQQVFVLAKNDEDPDAFISREMDRLIDWRDGELGKYHGKREADLKKIIAELRVPEYANDLIKTYGLKKSDLSRLMEVAPQDMEIRAKGLQELNELQKQIAGNNVKSAKRSKTAVSTGAGGSRNVRKILAGTDEHLFALDPSLRPANYQA